jgi:DHA2 family multidrug resistance protein-like MFS transporter
VAIANAPSADKQLITDSVVHQLQKSYAGAVDTAQNFPQLQYAGQITAEAKSAFLAGDQSAYAAGIVAILLGGVLVFFLFPKKDDEERLLTEYQSEDASRITPPASVRRSVAPWLARTDLSVM